MVDIIQVPTGTASDQMYLVNYGEDLWNALPPETQKYCKQAWLEKATTMKNIRYVGLRLIPDELFPSGTHELPYFAWQETINRDPEQPFTVAVEATVSLNANITLSPKLQSEIVRQLAVRYGTGTRWVIRQSGETLAIGKL